MPSESNDFLILYFRPENLSRQLKRDFIGRVSPAKMMPLGVLSWDFIAVFYACGSTPDDKNGSRVLYSKARHLLHFTRDIKINFSLKRIK